MDILQRLGIWLYFLIFFGKIIEVTVSTLRMVLINRGERVKGALIAFFDILLWLVITGTVLEGYQEDPLRILVFALAFSVGNYLGSWLEDKLAFGLRSQKATVPDSPKSKALAETLRSENFAVTVLRGMGRSGERDILLLHLKRKRIASAVALINAHSPDAVIVIADSRGISGGYIGRK